MPASSSPCSRARSTARLTAPTRRRCPAAPAATAFCTISNDTRPLTTSSRSRAGSRPSSSARPTTLSTALCRPTSSRTGPSVPSASARAAACTPPVRSKARWCARIASGKPASTSRGMVQPVGVRAAVVEQRRGRARRRCTPRRRPTVTKARGRGGRTPGAQGDVHAVGVVLAARTQRVDVVGALDAGLDDQPAGGELEVVPGRAHQGGDGVAVQPEHERRLHGEVVGVRAASRHRRAGGRSRAASWSPPCPERSHGDRHDIGRVRTGASLPGRCILNTDHSASRSVEGRDGPR